MLRLFHLRVLRPNQPIPQLFQQWSAKGARIRCHFAALILRRIVRTNKCSDIR